MKKAELIKGILAFLKEARKKGYAYEDDGAVIIEEVDGSKTIVFQKGDWKYRDNYFGGEPYGGREIIYYKNKAVWMMVYYGWVTLGFSREKVYPILIGALKKAPEDQPIRGPKRFKLNGFIYRCSFRKTEKGIERFSCIEDIHFNPKHVPRNKIVYKAYCSGGLIDQKSNGDD